ncbi:MAG: hypothetical protein ABIG35_05040 [Pseudomonadota bacterium]
MSFLIVALQRDNNISRFGETPSRLGGSHGQPEKTAKIEIIAPLARHLADAMLAKSMARRNGEQ